MSVLLAFIPFSVKGEEVRFTVSGPEQVIQGERFQMQYTLHNASGKNMKLPKFPGCNVLFDSGVSTGQSISIVNGSVSRQTTETHTVVLRAEKAGTYTFEPATIVADGKEFSSDSWKIQILPPDADARQAEDEEEEDLGLTSSQVASAVGQDAKTFFRVDLAKTKVYEQEPILATVKIYTRAQDIQLVNYTLPSFEGFLVQDVELPQNLSFGLEHYEGQNYKVAVLKKCWLFPQHTGTIKVTPASCEMNLITYRDGLSAFGFPIRIPQETNRKYTSPERSVTVMPLPKGKPADFSGGVGSFKLKGTISKSQVKTNEAVTIRLTLQGSGNLKYVKNPVIDFPNDFDSYDPKVDVAITPTDQSVSGTRVIEYTTIPRYAGDFTIPAAQFSYFDITSRSYKTLHTEAFHIHVEKGEGGNDVSIANFTNKEDLRLLNQDIHYIKLDNPRLKKDCPIYILQGWYWSIYVVLILLLIGAVWASRMQAKANSDSVRTKNRKANKVASKRLKAASLYLGSKDEARFYEEVLKAVWGYLSDKLNLPLSELNRDNVAAELAKYGADETLIGKFIEILDRCEFARYAPSQSSDAMDRLYSEAVEVIGNMENTIKK